MYQRSRSLAFPGNSAGSGTESVGNGTEPASTTTSVPRFPSPSPTDLSNILRDFINITDEDESERSIKKSEIECEADDEDEGDDSCVQGGEMYMSHKLGKRYTEHDFDFLEEEWLEPLDDETSDCTCNSSD